jgi:hypothetical protein
MNILPEQYSNLELSRSEKLFVTYLKTRVEGFSYLLLRINPACIESEELIGLIVNNGVLMFKFFETLSDVNLFGIVMPTYMIVYENIVATISKRLLGNKLFRDECGSLLLSMHVICVFPALQKSNLPSMSSSVELNNFINNHCLFSEEFSELRSNANEVIERLISKPNIRTSSNPMKIDDNNINGVFQRITPEYTTVRVGEVVEENTSAGASEECLVVTEDDRAIKAFMLDIDQINIINNIKKGEQLILACAGSGKSVLLLSKCFKAASMNPDKKFLITCYNRNLQSQYAWLIDKAGFRERNVECITFLTLCKRLLERNCLYLPRVNRDEVEVYFDYAAKHMNENRIRDRYYGVFIDEVQNFDQEWYKFCYNLLENKDSDDHFFVICGDKTQDIKKRQKQGKAPWNAGEGYPNYRGGNKNIRIERNYRNSIQINEYINRYVNNSKGYLHSFDNGLAIDPDLFLRGKAVREGCEVIVENIEKRTNSGEANAVIKAIMKIHKDHQIPYDEIAVVIYNKTYKGTLKNWKYPYNLITPLLKGLDLKNIPYAKMYSEDDAFAASYGVDNGVVLIPFESALGLDFRAVIVCGIKPLGAKDGTKLIDWLLNQGIDYREDKIIELINDFKKNISALYIACTRAKEVLHIITTENSYESIYVRILHESTEIKHNDD